SGLGKYAKLVPNSIVVGFTIGIAIAIATSNFDSALGLQVEAKGGFFQKVSTIFQNIGEFNGYALFLALLTFLGARYLLKISIFIPAPLLALGISTLLAA